MSGSGKPVKTLFSLMEANKKRVVQRPEAQSEEMVTETVTEQVVQVIPTKSGKISILQKQVSTEPQSKDLSLVSKKSSAFSSSQALVSRKPAQGFKDIVSNSSVDMDAPMSRREFTNFAFAILDVSKKNAQAVEARMNEVAKTVNAQARKEKTNPLLEDVSAAEENFSAERLWEALPWQAPQITKSASPQSTKPVSKDSEEEEEGDDVDETGDEDDGASDDSYGSVVKVDVFDMDNDPLWMDEEETKIPRNYKPKTKAGKRAMKTADISSCPNGDWIQFVRVHAAFQADKDAKKEKYIRHIGTSISKGVSKKLAEEAAKPEKSQDEIETDLEEEDAALAVKKSEQSKKRRARQVESDSDDPEAAKIEAQKKPATPEAIAAAKAAAKKIMAAKPASAPAPAPAAEDQAAPVSAPASPVDTTDLIQHEFPLKECKEMFQTIDFYSTFENLFHVSYTDIVRGNCGDKDDKLAEVNKHLNKRSGGTQFLKTALDRAFKIQVSLKGYHVMSDNPFKSPTKPLIKAFQEHREHYYGFPADWDGSEPNWDRYAPDAPAST